MIFVMVSGSGSMARAFPASIEVQYPPVKQELVTVPAHPSSPRSTPSRCYSSSTKVTGPSFRKSTCMDAANTPVRTDTPAAPKARTNSP